MTAMEEVRKISEEFFQKLSADTPEARRATDAINNYTRSLMYHRFTGMPKRGFMHQITPAQQLRPLAYWDRLGVPRSELQGPSEFDGQELYSWVLDGPLFYEIAERRLAREDFERRLAARQVPRWEWRSHEKLRRSLRRPCVGADRPILTLDQQEQRAYQIFGELVALILSPMRKE